MDSTLQTSTMSMQGNNYESDKYYIYMHILVQWLCFAPCSPLMFNGYVCHMEASLLIVNCFSHRHTCFRASILQSWKLTYNLIFMWYQAWVLEQANYTKVNYGCFFYQYTSAGDFLECIFHDFSRKEHRKRIGKYNWGWILRGVGSSCSYLAKHLFIFGLLGCVASNFKQRDSHTLEHSIIFFDLEKYDSI